MQQSKTERFGVLSLHTLGLLPEFWRFFWAMREFSAHYEAFKTHCQTMRQKDALAEDPYMAEIFSKPADEYARKKGYARFAFDYVAKFIYACTGASIETVTALDFLNVSMGLLVPIHRFKFDRQAITEWLGDRLVIDTILRMESRDQQYLLTGRSGKAYQAENIVLATPAAVTKELLGLEAIRGACQIFAYHVRAELKPAYRAHEINLFPFTSPLMLTARQFDGTTLIYGRVQEIDLGQVCERFEVLSMVAWEKAMYVFGQAYLEQQYGEGLYVAGDHNGLGLEPTAISGIYAANQIIHKITHTGGERRI